MVECRPGMARLAMLRMKGQRMGACVSTCRTRASPPPPSLAKEDERAAAYRRSDPRSVQAATQFGKLETFLGTDRARTCFYMAG